jgi:hypothetical protein
MEKFASRPLFDTERKWRLVLKLIIKTQFPKIENFEPK